MKIYFEKYRQLTAAEDVEIEKVVLPYQERYEHFRLPENLENYLNYLMMVAKE